jgi:hypothetical protein
MRYRSDSASYAKEFRINVRKDLTIRFAERKMRYGLLERDFDSV